MNDTKDVENEDDVSEIQIETAKKHYGNLYRQSILRVILYAIPALLFTIASLFLYIMSEEGLMFRGMSYSVPDFLLVISIAAAIACWGLFFWLKVRNSHKQAELWKKSMESYENLVKTESQFKTEEEKKQASKRSLRKAQREMAQQPGIYDKAKSIL